MPNEHSIGHDLAIELDVIAKKPMEFGPHPSVQRTTYILPVTRGKWRDLSTLAREQKTQARKKLRELDRTRKDLVRIYGEAVALLEDTQKSWVPLSRNPDWPAIRKNILQQLGTRTPTPEVEQMLKALSERTGTQMAAQIKRSIESMVAFLDRESAAWQSMFAGADLAHSVSTFNRNSEDRIDSLARVQQKIRKESSALEQNQRKVWQSLSRGDLAKAAQAAERLHEWTETLLSEVTKVAAAIANTRRSLGGQWTLGPLAVAVADLIRATLLARVLAQCVMRLSGAPFGETKEWMEAAASRPFPSQWAPPPSTDITDLWEKGASFADKTVTVEGVLGKVTNFHLRGKVYSSAWIFNRTGTSTRVGLTHIKLDSGGLVEGAYAKVTGTYKPFDTDFGSPILRIGRRKLEDDSKHSWLDWVYAELRQTFTPIPHGLTIAWSWEPGAVGACSQLRYGSWLPFDVSN